MATLGELYTSLDTLNSLGIDTTELKLQIQKMEQEVLEKEIIPSIKEVVDVLCSQLRTDVQFTISHSVGQSSDIKVGSHQSNNDNVSNNEKNSASFDTLPKFYVKNQKGAFGIGVYDSESNTFMLLPGSKVNGTTSNSFNRKDAYKEVTQHYCSFSDGLYVLEKVYTFASPSTASSVVLGRSSNGWTDWKDDSGKSLSEIYRK